MKESNTNMSTSTIDHSPISPERQPAATTAHALGERAVISAHHEIDIPTLRERFDTVGAIVRKNAHIHTNYPTLAKDPAKRSELLLRHHNDIEAPLMRLYEDYSETDQPFGDFVSAIIGMDADTKPSFRQRKLQSVIKSSIKHTVALRQVRALLDKQNISYTLPDEVGISDGVDLYINDEPCRFKLLTGATSLISAEVDGTIQRSLPDPFPDKFPSHYNLPQYKQKTELQIVNMLKSPVREEHKQKIAAGAEPKIPQTRLASPNSQKDTVKSKSAKQIAHEARMLQQKNTKAAKQATQELPIKKAAVARKTTKIKSVPNVIAYEQDSIVIGKPGDGVPLSNEFYEEPPYAARVDLESVRGEEYALQVINEALGDKTIDNYKITTEQAGRLIIDSISVNSPKELIVLKIIAAQICGVKTRRYKLNQLQIVKILNNNLRTSEFRDFYSHIYEWSHPDAANNGNKLKNIMGGLSGFRGEASVAKLARAAGYDVVEATAEQDAKGLDLFIDGVPFDVKLSYHTLEAHSKRTEQNQNRYHPIKFVPPFTVEDFDGEFIIPDRNIEEVIERTNFRELIDSAVAQYIKMDVGDEATEDEVVSAEKSQAEQEMDKIALNATRYWKRKNTDGSV